MSKIFRILMLSCFFVWFSVGVTSAQTTGEATMSADMLIKLTGSLESERFFVPYAAVAFKDEIKAQVFASVIDDNLLDFEFSKEEAFPQGFILVLKKQYAPAAWTVAEWNQYLAGKKDYFNTLLSKINNE
jgi:hypothetical protein